MTSIAQTKSYYTDYDWSCGGNEWSRYWGSSDVMWKRTILPRINRFLPAETVVEIGCGFGRVSRLLHRYATERLILTDYMPRCVQVCDGLFQNQENVACLLTDGKSLAGIADESVDLVFSFYSLVDADVNVIDSYTGEFMRILKKDGVVFLHHSNAGAYFDSRSCGRDKRMQMLSAYRDISMSARVMRRIAHDNGLACMTQECVNWDMAEVLSDCFSVLVRPDSKWSSEQVYFASVDLCREMKLARKEYRTRNGNR